MAKYSIVRRGLVAVTSCKGGVGKSTVSANLAFTLARRGHNVGLFDADVQGPSLPTQLPELTGSSIRLNDGGWSVEPLQHDGVRLMSFGWFAQSWGVSDGEVRGKAPTLAYQLLHTTKWGDDLDYLIIDSPPGTGDVPRALYTRVPLSGALVVTTPSRLATVDVVRGVKMLRRMKVPILGVVENLSSFGCDGCGTTHFPFGSGHLNEVLASVHDEPSDGSEASHQCRSFRLPIVATDGDTGVMSNASAPLGANAAMAAQIEAVAIAVESSCSAEPLDAEPASIALPHALRSHELPHWPTIMATNELFQ